MGLRHSKTAPAGSDAQSKGKTSDPGKRKRRVAIVGAGAAGLAAAWSLSRHPDSYEVEVWEALPEVGGVASTCQVVPSSGESVEINDQVQGGAPSYRNNLLLLEKVGVTTTPVDFKISFGTGDGAWSNHGPPSELVRRLRPEIKRFGRALRWVSRLEWVFIFVPMERVLRWWGFSDEFRNQMVFPLTALFFGTGNQTPRVSAAVVARVFLDPQLRLFQYSEERLLDEVPRMFAFPKLRDIYEKVVADCGASVTVHTGRHVDALERSSDGVTLRSGDVTAQFDDVVLASGAEESLRMLGDGATRAERKRLGSVTYYNDLIVTHEDEEYMARHYTFDPVEDMYFVRCDPDDARIIEMSFNLAAYQPHLAKGGKAVYQTIFLDDNLKEKWTLGEIDSEKVLKTRATRQFAHTWTHFAHWVPYVSGLQGNKGVWHAGAVTLFNTHEIAVMSGLAAADRLGAPYPFKGVDSLAEAQYMMFFRLAHGAFTRRS